VNTKGPSKKKKGRSKRAHVLVAAVKKATENFIEKGEQIAYENPDIKQEMLSAVEEVRVTGKKYLGVTNLINSRAQTRFVYYYAGKSMSGAAEEFADDPCSSQKRSNMVRAARNLLSAVTRLLILADMVDVYLLLKSLRVVSEIRMPNKHTSVSMYVQNTWSVFGNVFD
jgi:catenin alpha